MPHKNIEERRAYARAYHARNKEKKNEYARNWYKQNPDKIKEQRRRWYANNQQSIRAYRENNKERIRAYDKERAILNNCKKYGIDPESIPRPLTCELCNRTDGKIAFDHDHDTGRFRGILCAQCNVALGMVNDNPVLLENMAKYLRARK